MSKTRQKNHSETEHLRGLVKKLKSENRQLRKRLKELDRRSHFYQDIIDEVAEEVEVKNVCPSCKKGIVEELNFVHIIVEKCNQCDYQKNRKPKKK